MSGDEARTDANGQTIHPALTGRGWCDVCDQPTARWVPKGVGYWRHGHCETGETWVVYLTRIGKEGRAKDRAPEPPR